jgi:hypothetical protein
MAIRNPFAWALDTVRALWSAWRDIGDLVYPYSVADYSWNRQLEERAHEVAVNYTLGAVDEKAACGRCDWCDRAIWWRVTVSSAGYPVSHLLCSTCATSVLENSPHVLELCLSARRAQWLAREARQ